MSYSVSGTMITLTRGDTFTALITITDSEGNQYVPVKGDRIRFAMKTDYEDGAPLLIKEIPIDTQYKSVRMPYWTYLGTMHTVWRIIL